MMTDDCVEHRYDFTWKPDEDKFKNQKEKIAKEKQKKAEGIV